MTEKLKLGQWVFNEAALPDWDYFAVNVDGRAWMFRDPPYRSQDGCYDSQTGYHEFNASFLGYFDVSEWPKNSVMKRGVSFEDYDGWA